MGVLTGAGNVSTAQAGSGTSLALTRPANAVEGGVVYAFVYPRLSTAPYSTPPPDWVLVAQSSTTAVGWQGLYRKVLGASEPGSYTWAGGASGRHTGVMFIAADDGGHDVTGTAATLINANTVNSVIEAPAVDPTEANTFLLGLAGNNTTGNAPRTFDVPAGMTLVGQVTTSTGGSDSCCHVSWQQLTADTSTGTRSFAAPFTNVASGQGFLVAIRTAAVATTPIGQPAESDTATSTGRLKSRVTAAGAETDVALSVAGAKHRALAVAVETDSAQELTRAQSLGIAVESDRVPPAGLYPGPGTFPGEETVPGGPSNLKPLKRATLGQAVEIDAAAGVIPLAVVASAGEIDLALPVAQVKRQLFGLAAEFDTAIAVAGAKTVLAEMGVSVEAAGALSATKVRALDSPTVGEFAALLDRTKTVELGQAVDTHTTDPVTSVKTTLLGGVVETSAAAPLARQRLIGQPVEFDEATSLGTIGPVVVGPAVSGETARPVTAVKRSVLGRAVDTHSATAMANSLNQVDAGVETDSARPVVGVKTTVLGVAVETTTVSVLEQVKSVLLGAGAELDGAFELIGAAPVVALGQAVEWESGLPLLTGSAAVDGWPPSVSGPFWDPLLVVSAP